MSNYSKLGKNTLLVFVGNVGSKIIGLLLLPFYTRWLSVEDYGMTDLVTTYVAFLLSISTCSIADAIFVFPKDKSNKEKTVFFTSGLCFVVGCFIILFLLFYLSEDLMLTNGIFNVFSQYIWLIYGLIVSQFFQQYLQQFVRSIDKMVVFSMTGIVLTVSTAIFSFLLIPFLGVYGYILSLIFSNFVAAIYSFVFAQLYNYISFSAYKWSFCKLMLKFSIPLIPNGIMWWFISALNRPVMENYVGLSGIGLFAIANKFPNVITLIFAAFTTSWQISVLDEYKNSDFSKFFNNVYYTIFLFLVIVYFGMAIMGMSFLKLLTTEDYYGAYIYIPILTFAALFLSMANLGASIFLATKESKYYLYSSVGGAIVALIGNFTLIPMLGVLGAAISVVISVSIVCLLRIKYMWKYVQIQNLSKYFILILLCVISMVQTYMISKFHVYINLILLVIVLFVNREFILSASLKLKGVVLNKILRRKL